MTKNWHTLEDNLIADLKIFKARAKKRVNPETDIVSEFVVLDSPDWVNIIPITAEGKIVMVEQYRHGTDSVTIELPGGMVEKDEDFANAATRECIEETGYEGIGMARMLGQVRPNPAFLNNKCTTYVWNSCSKNQKQNLDRDELIRVKEFTLSEVKSMIESGEINHSIILNAFFFLFLDNEYTF